MLGYRAWAEKRYIPFSVTVRVTGNGTTALISAISANHRISVQHIAWGGVKGGTLNGVVQDAAGVKTISAALDSASAYTYGAIFLGFQGTPVTKGSNLQLVASDAATSPGAFVTVEGYQEEIIG